MRTFKKLWNPTFLAILALAIGTIVGFQISVNAREQAKKQGCLSVIEAYNLVADAVSISVPPASPQQTTDPALPEPIQKLMEQFRDYSKDFRQRFEIRLNKPIPLCEAVGIHRKIELGKADGTRITYQALPIPTIVIQKLKE